MDPHMAHLSNPYQEALLVGGIVAILAILFFLSTPPKDGYSRSEVLALANGSDTVTSFLETNEVLEVSIEREDEKLFLVTYTAEEENVTVSVDMDTREVSTR